MYILKVFYEDCCKTFTGVKSAKMTNVNGTKLEVHFSDHFTKLVFVVGNGFRYYALIPLKEEKKAYIDITQ